MQIVKAIPLFLYLLVAYNVVMLSGEPAQVLANTLFSGTLPSDAEWSLNLSELFIALGVIALYIEILKATRTSIASVIDHAMSMIVFVIFLIEFIVMPAAGNSTFLILSLMAALDVIAGFTITIVGARRDIGLGDGVR